MCIRDRHEGRREERATAKENQGTHIARINYLRTDERDNQEDYSGNRKTNPDSGNAKGRNRRNEDDIEPYVFDPYCDDPIERFTTAYNLRNPPENHIGGASRTVVNTGSVSYTHLDVYKRQVLYITSFNYILLTQSLLFLLHYKLHFSLLYYIRYTHFVFWF